MMCKGLSRSCGRRGLPTGTARAVRASEGWGEAGKFREESQKLEYIWGNPANSTRPKKTLHLIQDRQ